MRKTGERAMAEAETRVLTDSPKLAKRISENAAWCDESRFLLCYSEVRVRIWHSQHERKESMDPRSGCW